MDGRYDLSKEQPGFGFWQTAFYRDSCEQLAITGIFEDNVELGKGLHNLIETNDVRMMQLLHAGDLT